MRTMLGRAAGAACSRAMPGPPSDTTRHTQAAVARVRPLIIERDPTPCYAAETETRLTAEPDTDHDAERPVLVVLRPVENRGQAHDIGEPFLISPFNEESGAVVSAAKDDADVEVLDLILDIAPGQVEKRDVEHEFGLRVEVEGRAGKKLKATPARRADAEQNRHVEVVQPELEVSDAEGKPRAATALRVQRLGLQRHAGAERNREMRAEHHPGPGAHVVRSESAQHVHVRGQLREYGAALQANLDRL